VASWTAGSGSVSVPYRFQGRRLQNAQAGTDLYDFGARSYDPDLGSFTSFDTVAGSAQNPLTLNRYLYTLANPGTMIDPDGHIATMYADGGSPGLRTMAQVLADAQKKKQTAAALDKQDDTSETTTPQVWVQEPCPQAGFQNDTGLPPACPMTFIPDPYAQDTYGVEAAQQTYDLLSLGLLIVPVPGPGAVRGATLLSRLWNGLKDLAILTKLTLTAKELTQVGALGFRFRNLAVVGFQDAKELATAKLVVSERGGMIAKLPISGIPELKNPDSILRLSGKDPGTIWELKNLNAASSKTVQNALQDKASQLRNSAYGTGSIAVNGVEAGLTRAAAEAGLQQALKAGAAGSGGLNKVQDIIIFLADGTVLTWP
jgi:RHS repeat-associated protein